MTNWKRSSLATVIFTLAIVCMTVAEARAQNPCTASVSGVVIQPGKLYAVLPEHTFIEADGVTPRVTDYQVTVFAPGVNPQTNIGAALVAPVTVPKTAFTLVAGTTNCYLLTPLPFTVPASPSQVVAYVKSRRAAFTFVSGGVSTPIPAAESLWSSPASNPFGVVPSVLLAPGPVIIQQ